jgi:hypothetical protein
MAAQNLFSANRGLGRVVQTVTLLNTDSNLNNTTPPRHSLSFCLSVGKKKGIQGQRSSTTQFAPSDVVRGITRGQTLQLCASETSLSLHQLNSMILKAFARVMRACPVPEHHFLAISTVVASPRAAPAPIGARTIENRIGGRPTAPFAWRSHLRGFPPAPSRTLHILSGDLRKLLAGRAEIPRAELPPRLATPANPMAHEAGSFHPRILLLILPFGFPQLRVLIRREFEPQAASSVRNRVFKRLTIFHRHHDTAPLGKLEQFCGVTQNQLARQRCSEILFEELAIPPSTPHEVEIDLALRCFHREAALTTAFARHVRRRQRVAAQAADATGKAGSHRR